MCSSPHLWFCACKTETLGLELKVCGSKTPPVDFVIKTATFGPEEPASMGTRHDLSFCACTTACLASELAVSMGPRPHLWILIAKQRFLEQNYKSL